MAESFNESTVEEAALSWFDELGYSVASGPELAPGEAAAERASFGDVVLAKRLRDAIDRLNPKIPADARDEAFRRLLLTRTQQALNSAAALTSTLAPRRLSAPCRLSPRSGSPAPRVS